MAGMDAQSRRASELERSLRRARFRVRFLRR